MCTACVHPQLSVTFCRTSSGDFWFGRSGHPDQCWQVNVLCWLRWLVTALLSVFLHGMQADSSAAAGLALNSVVAAAAAAVAVWPTFALNKAFTSSLAVELASRCPQFLPPWQSGQPWSGCLVTVSTQGSSVFGVRPLRNWPKTSYSVLHSL